MTIRLNDTEWLRRQLGPDGCSVDGRTANAGADGLLIAGGAAKPNPDDPGLDQGGARPRRFNRRVVRLGGLIVVGMVITLLGVMLLNGGDKPAGRSGKDPVPQGAAGTTAAPTPLAAEAAGMDRPLPFTAAANCPAGSTSAQTLAGADPTNAFVCVRDLIDGQVIRLDLTKTYVITAISITPGWVGKDSSGVSQWSQHRVVTRVQYAFNDTDHTMIVQDTGNVHGEAVQPVKHVLASKITMLILQTSRPPAETASPSPTPGLGSSGGGLFGDPGTDPSLPPTPAPLMGMSGPATTDPVDATFAISRLKIIGHEAI